jgi:hypothetical protein
VNGKQTGGRADGEKECTTGCVPSELGSEDTLLQNGDAIALWLSVF